jgi:non-specific serine/threonine protein kinase/serine/threonine-protein kinase
MPPDQTERVAELVDAALQREPAERAAFLDEACRETPELRAEVDSLLAFQNDARDFIETPAYESAGEVVLDQIGELRVGQSLGDYKIVSLLAEGGMGEVYLAEDTALDRKVAIKLIKAGLGATSFVRHFRNEQRILAGLNHPNIARLYDAAITNEGLPYFVMEYVEGARIDGYCRANSSSLGERLQLFLKVCAAVGFAHRHLIIHRDLKPANIRLTPEGEPKLLDFGIAKLLDPETASMAEQTMTLQALMTPDYASPEQVRGETMTTASDVYSLGVVLYELLTGQRPYRLTSRRPDEIARAIREQEPTRPSSAAGSAPSAIQNPKLLRGDLDNIVLKAIRKEPERRYQSMRQFAEDIERHLDGRPVTARKDTIGYRGEKFVRRHAVGVAAAALVLLTLIGGVIATLVEAQHAEKERALAERRFNEVRQLAHSLMFEIHDSVQDLQGSTPTRRLIVSRALQYLDGLARDAGNNSDLQRELAAAYEKVGDIQGNPYTANLGDADGALTSYRKATAIREGLNKSDSSAEARLALAISYRGIGDIMMLKGNLIECLKNYRHSLLLIEELAKSFQTDLPVQRELGRAYDTLGDGLARTEQNAECLQAYRKSLAIHRHLAEQNPKEEKLQRSVAIELMKVADTEGVLKAEATANINEALAIFARLSAADPENARARRELGWAYYQAGKILSALGDQAAALPDRQKALDVRERVAADDPKNKQARFDLAAANGELAESYENLHEPEKALEHARRCAELFNELVASDPQNVIYSRNLGLACERVGGAQTLLAKDETQPAAKRLQNLREARSSYAKALELFTGMRDRGALMPNDAHQIPKFTKKIGDTDVEIGKLSQ